MKSGLAAFIANTDNFAALQRSRISAPSHDILGGDINRPLFDPTDGTGHDH